MKKALILSLIFLGCLHSHGQSPLDLFNKQDFQSLVKLETKADQLTSDELYMVGFAFFRLENDKKAVEFYDKAIAKGLNNGTVHFYKGVSLRYLKNYEEALKEIELAMKLEPTSQEYMNEKGMVFYSQSIYDKALDIFEQAKKLPSTHQEPYFWIARIYHEKEEFNKALAAYYDALKNLPKDNSYYLNSLMSIGELEFTVTKDYKKSADAYLAAMALDNENYELYYKLIKSYNAAKDYEKAESLFQVVKKAFERGELPKEDMEIKTIAIAQFEWNGQIAVIRRSLVEPKEMLDISYKVFLLTKEADKVERRFLVEKTIQLENDGVKYLLCEQGSKGSHATYPYGWKTDIIPVDDLQRAVVSVLEGQTKAGASSSYNK